MRACVRVCTCVCVCVHIYRRAGRAAWRAIGEALIVAVSIMQPDRQLGEGTSRQEVRAAGGKSTEINRRGGKRGRKVNKRKCGGVKR